MAAPYTVLFKAPEAGTAVLDWYELPAGAKLARKSKPKPVLVASGERTFSAAGTAKITLKLTTAGKLLLKHARHLQLTAKCAFTPTGEAPVEVKRAFSLRR